MFRSAGKAACLSETLPVSKAVCDKGGTHRGREYQGSGLQGFLGGGSSYGRG